MANNRMFLVSSRTGESVCIAKYYQGTGWYIGNPHDLSERLTKLFENDKIYSPSDDEHPYQVLYESPDNCGCDNLIPPRQRTWRDKVSSWLTPG